jgi:hypothetical protein
LVNDCGRESLAFAEISKVFEDYIGSRNKTLSQDSSLSQVKKVCGHLEGTLRIYNRSALTLAPEACPDLFNETVFRNPRGR